MGSAYRYDRPGEHIAPPGAPGGWTSDTLTFKVLQAGLETTAWTQGNLRRLMDIQEIMPLLRYRPRLTGLVGPAEYHYRSP